jgi:hypothetical protein
VSDDLKMGKVPVPDEPGSKLARMWDEGEDRRGDFIARNFVELRGALRVLRGGARDGKGGGGGGGDEEEDEEMEVAAKAPIDGWVVGAVAGEALQGVDRSVAVLQRFLGRFKGSHGRRAPHGGLYYSYEKDSSI